MAAKKIPPKIRRSILEEKLIDKAVNIAILNSPIDYLFNIYENYLDPSGEYDDWNCPKCRQHVLDTWRRIKPYLEELENVAKLANI